MEDNSTNKFYATFGSSNLAVVGGLSFQGTWDALNNVPLIQSGIGVLGQYYVVSVAGNTNIDGTSDWDVGDWIIFNGTAWQKIDNSDQVTSVNGLQGAVSIGLNSVLGENNTTGANDISVNSGQNIIFNNGGFTGTLQEGTYTGNQVYTLPDASGTIALVSDPSGAIYLNDLADVTTGLPVPTTIEDDGRLIYYSHTLGEWITKEEITFATIVLDAKKDTAGIIAKGTPVYLAGYDSDVITIEEADASNPAKMNCIGVAVEPINNLDADKHIIKFGKLTGLDTTGTPYGEVWNLGDILWVATGGGFTKTRPTGTAIIQRIAQVLKVDATGGQLEIFNTWRSAGLPNLAQNKTWVGDASGYPVETDISTFNQNLSQVLGVGNVTDGQNIIANSDSVIRTNNATPLNRMALQLFNDTTDYMALGSDLFAPNLIGGSVQLYDNSLRIGVYTGVAQQGVSLQFLESSKEVRLSRNNVASSNYDFFITSSIDFYLGGATSFGKSLLKPTTLTADRTYTFQDASGIVAFLSDIPSNAGDTLYVTDGTLTSNRIVSTNGFDLAFVTSTGGFVNIDDSNAQLTIEGTIIGTTPKLVVKGETSFGTTRINDQYAPEIIKYFQIGTGGILSLTQAPSSVPRTQTFQDASGTIALLSDIPASLPTTSPLSVVLTNGNTTGANNIIVTDGQDIRSSTSGNTLNLDDPAEQVGNSAFSLTQDNSSYGANTSWVYGETNNGMQIAYQISGTEAMGVGVWNGGISPQFFTGKEIGINDNRTQIAQSGNVAKRAVFVGTRNSSIASTLINVVVVGGNGINASVSDALYTNQLRLQASGNNNDGILDIATLTADRNYTLQDASGTLAFLTDIPSTPTLSAVLSAGNTTSGQDIRLSNGDWIETDNATANNRMIIRSINGGASPDTISITRRVSGSPIPLPTQPTAQITFSDDVAIGVLENNGYSRMQFNTNGDILFASANPTKNFTIDSSYQFRLQLGGAFCNLNASGNATLTFPTGTGTIAITSDFQTGQAYTPTNVVTDRSFDANSTSLNEIADVLGTLINDLQSVNILS
jgi:hypothetical protein